MNAPVQEGEVLAGKYRVERLLGVGGMGVVVAATHLQLGQLVALKFMLPAALGNADHVARFLREARAAVRLKNEHVARVLDLGTLDGGAPFIVFEFLDGCDLSVLLKERGRLAVADAVELVLQAGEALAEAHSLGIVHRDLKPTNLFLIHRPDGSPCVKVLDFGISKVAGPDDLAITKTSTVMGSPAYMSPEQMRSARDVDARSDIWSLGGILFQLLAGRVPFEGESITELCVKVLQDQPPPLDQVRRDVPPGVERAVLRCLEKDRDHRYQTLAELASDLQPFAPARAHGAAERIATILQVARAATGNAPRTPAPDHDRTVISTPELKLGGGRRRALVAGGAVIALLAAAAVVWMVRHPSASPATASAIAAPLPAAPQQPAPPTAIAPIATPRAPAIVEPPAPAAAPATPRAPVKRAATPAKKHARPVDDDVFGDRN